ncbi:hypothetical protein [Desulforamulus reducens]
MRVLTWLRGNQAYGDIPFNVTDMDGKRHQITF